MKNTSTLRLAAKAILRISLFLLPVFAWAQPANDLCSAATPLTQDLVCTTTTATLVGSTVTTPTLTVPCTGTAALNDVWFIFTARSVNPTITLSSAPTNSRFQIYTTSTCGGVETSMYCSSGLTGTPNNLVAGTSYLVRVYSTTNNSGTFNICITTASQANTCGSSFTLTSGNPGPKTQGYVLGATNDGVASSCAVSAYDVWYRFVASTASTTVSLTNTGSEFLNPAIEVYSGSCAALVSLGCGTTSLTLNNLTLGTTYLVRIYSAGGAAPVTKANSGFEIAVNDVVIANDLCSTAELITSYPGTCVAATQGNLKYSTASPSGDVPAGCGDPTAGDVWYKFVAQSSYPNIVLGSVGSSITNAAQGGGIRMQLLEGGCGTFSQIVCATGSYNTSSLAAGRTLIIGNTYYIRISTLLPMTGTPATGSAYRFTLCITDPTVSNTPKFGNTYVNLSKKNTGGVVETGDTLEIRMTISLAGGVQYYPRYLDNIPTNTAMLTGASDSIRVITNEGLTYKAYTVSAGDDAASYVAAASAGEYNIRMNFGFGASMPPPTAPANNSATDITGAKQMTYNSRPIAGGRLLFASAFRVVVTGAPGSVITLGTGRFMYRPTPSGIDTFVTTVPYQIAITTPKTLCANATGVNNAQEFGGTFGTGNTLNRSTPLTFAPTAYAYVPNMGSAVSIGDGTYGIVKNMSPRNATNRAAARAPLCAGPFPTGDSCVSRMFGGFWDVDGDHSGTSTMTGNIPPADGVDGGYMLLVNADYVASEVYRQNITGLCPNTYYEFSAWIRNVCPVCGVDSVGTQTYKPGVTPNLTFILDDVDQYNTGEIQPDGWEKKGFVFVTGPTQTSATFSIRNNAQGGGGNDWAMDDISIATCLPNMSYSPSLNPSVCSGNSLTINDTIRSIYNNYRHHLWQKSTNNGATWSDVSAVRDSVPVYNPTTKLYSYITSYTIPPVSTTGADSGTLYRVIVATTASNVVSPSCQVTDGISIINLAVQNCAPVLSTDLLSFSGRLLNDKGNLSWTTSKEESQVTFDVERSADGRAFFKIGSVNGYNNNASLNNYSLTDPTAVNGVVFYRLAMITIDGKKKYSRIVQLSTKPEVKFELVNVINPFQSSLRFDVSSPSDSRIEATLVDMFGKTVKNVSYTVYTGVNTFTLPSTDNLPAGTYVLLISHENEVLHRKVVKQN